MGVVNGGFETGNLNSWSVATLTGNATITVVSNDKHSGLYSAQIILIDDGFTGPAISCSQSLGSVTATNLSFWYRIKVKEGLGTKFYVSAKDADMGEVIHNLYVVTPEWTYYLIDLTALTARDVSMSVSFGGDSDYYNGTTLSVNIDDIALGGGSPPPDPISFPDIWNSNPATQSTSSFSYDGNCKDYYSFASSYSSEEYGDNVYGEGLIVLDFSTVSRSPVAVATFTKDINIWNYELNTDLTKLYSVVHGKGSKYCGGGTMQSGMSDFATALLTVWPIDTYIRSYTIVDTYDCEINPFSITQFGSGGEGYATNWESDAAAQQMYFRVRTTTGTTTELMQATTDGATIFCYDPSTGFVNPNIGTFSPLYNLGAFDVTGSAADVDGFIANLDSSVLVGSEIIELHTATPYLELNATTVRLFIKPDTRSSATTTYVHGAGVPVFCQSVLGANAVATSMYAQYGAVEVYSNPVGIIDNNTLDLHCWEIMENATNKFNWGKFQVSAHTFPTTLEIGDWIDIENQAQTATTTYKITGIEYDSKKGVYTIELGSTEDYYLEQSAQNKGTFDLSLSNT